MSFENIILYDVNDLYDIEPEHLGDLERIDRRDMTLAIIGSRIKNHFRGYESADILDCIVNPEVFRESAIYLNLQLVFYANSGSSGDYLRKAEYYALKYEESLKRALEQIEIDGFETTGPQLVR